MKVDMLRLKKLLAICAIFWFTTIFAQEVLVEAESFDNPGGWVVDPQFEQQMGPPYLLAHGMGIPVNNASTMVNFYSNGEYIIIACTN